MEENRFISNFKKNNPNIECPQNLGLKWSIIRRRIITIFK